MSYALLILEPVGQRATRTEAEGREVYGRMVHFAEELRQRGVLTVAQSLKTGTSDAQVKVRGDSVMITDGPFTEVKEVMGGFFLLTCGTREEALEIARQCPAAQWATVEVREFGPCFM